MKKSRTVAPKRRGRPPIKGGRDPHIAARMPPPLIAEVEAWAASKETSRSDAFRRLVELGLKVKKVKPSPQRRDLWTKEEEERLRQLFLQHAVPGEIAQGLNRTASAVKSKAHALGITIAVRGPAAARDIKVGLKAKK